MPMPTPTAFLHLTNQALHPSTSTAGPNTSCRMAPSTPACDTPAAQSPRGPSPHTPVAQAPTPQWPAPRASAAHIPTHMQPRHAPTPTMISCSLTSVWYAWMGSGTSVNFSCSLLFAMLAKLRVRSMRSANMSSRTLPHDMRIAAMYAALSRNSCASNNRHTAPTPEPQPPGLRPLVARAMRAGTGAASAEAQPSCLACAATAPAPHLGARLSSSSSRSAAA
eukprot:352235-Chlamydomonas_euryale.AAC.6